MEVKLPLVVSIFSEDFVRSYGYHGSKRCAVLTGVDILGRSIRCPERRIVDCIGYKRDGGPQEAEALLSRARARETNHEEEERLMYLFS